MVHFKITDVVEIPGDYELVSVNLKICNLRSGFYRNKKQEKKKM